MLIVTNGSERIFVGGFLTDLDYLSTREKVIVLYLHSLNFPGIAVHLERKQAVNFSERTNNRVTITVLMRPFGYYGSLGRKMEGGDLDSNWNPSLDNPALGEFDLSLEDKKLSSSEKKYIVVEIKNFIKVHCKTVRLYKKLLKK